MEQYREKKWESRAISNFDLLLPSTEQLANVDKVAELALKSGYLGKDAMNKEKVEFIIMKGLEVGLQPIQALSQISVIQGKPTIGAEGMMFLIYKNCPGAKLRWVMGTDPNTSITIIAKRDESDDPSKFSYSIEDAKRAGLANKDTWQKYPRAMLRARVISEMARAIFPDCLGGISYTPEELGANVDMDGNIVESRQPIPIKSAVTATEMKEIVEAKKTQIEEQKLIAPELESKRIVKATKKAKEAENAIADLLASHPKDVDDERDVPEDLQ
jgi:hypothetical protein